MKGIHSTKVAQQSFKRLILGYGDLLELLEKYEVPLLADRKQIYVLKKRHERIIFEMTEAMKKDES